MVGRLQSSQNRTMMRQIDADDFADDISKQLDVIDILELAVEAPQIIENAQAAAAAGSAGTFEALMEQFNPGQKALADQYCMPYAEEYWMGQENPDPDDYLSGMYMLHEAIEQALSDACEMSYESGRTAGAVALANDLSAYVSQELLSRGMTMAGIKRVKENWGQFADELKDAEAMGAFSGNGWQYRKTGGAHSRFRNEFADSMFIGDNLPTGSFSGAVRQLSGRQFMGIDQPYWFTETRRMSMAAGQGHMSQSEFQAKKAELYRATLSNPWSTSRPGGYSPYDGPEWEYRGHLPSLRR